MDDIDTLEKKDPRYQELDALLKCGICHETMVTPVLTSCSHSYCSLCIRKWLDTKKVCPTCSKEEYENSLRKNPIVENIIEAVNKLKKMTGFKGSAGYLNPLNEKPSTSSPSTSKPFSQKLERTSNNLVRNDHLSGTDDDSDDFAPRPSVWMVSQKTPKNRYSMTHRKIASEEEDEEKVDDVISPSTNKRFKPLTPKPKPQAIPTPFSPQTQNLPTQLKVPCPVCFTLYPERVINEHLDKCLDSASSCSSENKSHVAKSGTSGIVGFASQKVESRSSRNQGESSTQRLQPIKKLVYNLLSDTELKKELKKLGLSSQGNRRTLMSRIQRYVVMHNAECDATHPRSLDELRKQFEKDEKALAAPTANTVSNLFKTKQPNPEEFESVRKEYLWKNKDSYQSLIEEVKRRGQKKPAVTDGPVNKIQTVLHGDSESESSSEIVRNTKTKHPHPSQSMEESRKTHSLSDSDDFSNPVQKSVKRKQHCFTDSDEEAFKTEKKSVKRKPQNIESESEDEGEEPRKNIPLKTSSSPVLSAKTPVRRQLRSRSERPTAPNKSTRIETKNTNRKKMQKKNSDKPVTAEVQGSVKSSMSAVRLPEPKRITPDLFGSPPSPASSEIPCGQKYTPQREGLESDSGEALSQLVSLMNEDSGSSTDFE